MSARRTYSCQIRIALSAIPLDPVSFLLTKNAKVTLVYQHELPNVPGKSIKGVLVEIWPARLIAWPHASHGPDDPIRELRFNWRFPTDVTNSEGLGVTDYI
jgi:hypothetical protein